MSVVQRTGTARLLFNAAHHMGLQPSWVVPDGLFAVTVDGREEYVNHARSPLNSAVSTSLAQNKYLTRMILERHGMRNIPFMHPRTHEMAEAFLAKHGKIIVKPLEGSGSRDIHIITERSQLKNFEIQGYILEKYITGKELRYLLLNNSVLAVYESEYGSSVAVDRPLRCISYPPAMWDDRLAKESLRIAEVLRLRFAAVDYLIDAEGHHHVLEVNTMPDLKWFHAPSSGPTTDVAGRFLKALYARDSTRDSKAEAVEVD